MSIQYIQRSKSVVTGEENLEHLHTFSNFPVFIGCTDELSEKDLFADISFSICPKSGVIQLDKVLPLELIYSGYHSEAIGGVWTRHRQEFLLFLESYGSKNFLEIGGSNGALALMHLVNYPDSKWTIVEPNPSIESSGNLTVIKDVFDARYCLDDSIECIVHSHVFEHMYYPDEFISNISKVLPEGKLHIFSVPNLLKYLQNKYTNCMNFEHTVFLTEGIIDYLLKKHGFEILQKKAFEDHSVMYATRKIHTSTSVEMSNYYTQYKTLFSEFVDDTSRTIQDFNERLRGKNNVFLFGAHVFSQFLIHQGIDTANLVGIIDNSVLKQGKRLYGTSYTIYSPDILMNYPEVCVVLRAGGYQDEIRSQLLQLHPNITIIE